MEERTQEHRLQPAEGWGVPILALGMLVMAGATLTNSGWAPGLSVAPSVVLVGFFFAYLAAKSRLPGILAFPFFLTVGFAWCFRLTAGLFPEGYDWNTRWGWTWWRLYSWVRTLAGTGTADDNLVFVLHVCFLLWLCCCLTVWFLVHRHQAWPALLVTGIPLLIAQKYAPRNVSLYVASFLVLGLLLVARMHLFRQQQAWLAGKVHFNAGELTFDVWRSGLVVAVVVVGLAWWAPTAMIASHVRALDVVRGPLNDLEYMWSRWFSGLNTRSSPAVDFSGESLNLGGPRQLPLTPVLLVQAPPLVRYRRMVTFDTYTGAAWVNSDKTVVRFGADALPPALIVYRSRQPVTMTVTALVAGSSVLAAADQPISVSRSARANVTHTPVLNVEGETVAQAVDTLSFVRSRIPFDAGEEYTVTSLVSRASPSRLRGDIQVYPRWVTNRYLQLPNTIPARVRQLARTVTAGTGANPYDRATAIERYLRREIVYNDAIGPPPAHRDPSDYILFDSKEGYCDYYATAMVVMLRTLGIPARVVAGYSQGEYRFEDDGYVVTMNNAHSWVEVFFPTYGWVDFEPTADQPEIERPPEIGDAHLPEGTSRGEEPPPADEKEATTSSRMDRIESVTLGTGSAGAWLGRVSGWAATLCLGTGVLALAILVSWLRRRWGIGLPPVEAVYHRQNLLSAWAGVPVHDWQTPLERAEALARVLPQGSAAAGTIAAVYTHHRYGHRRITLLESADLRAAWDSLRPQLLRAVVVRNLRPKRGN